MNFSIFTTSSKLVLPAIVDDIDDKLINSAVVLTNYTYLCKKTGEEYEFIPKADSFLAGNATIPHVKALVKKMPDNECLIVLNGRTSLWVKIFTSFFVAFSLLLFLLLWFGSLFDDASIVGPLISLGMITFALTLTKVSLLINMHFFKSALRDEFKVTEAM